MKAHVISEWPFWCPDSGDCWTASLIPVSSCQAEPQGKVPCGARLGQAVGKTGRVDLAPPLSSPEDAHVTHSRGAALPPESGAEAQ